MLSLTCCKSTLDASNARRFFLRVDFFLINRHVASAVALQQCLEKWDRQTDRQTPDRRIMPSTTNAHTHPFNGLLSGTTRVNRYQKGKTNLDFTEARDSEWQWHHLGRMQVCTSLHTDNHASTPPLSFLQAGCPSCGPTNSVKALKEVLRMQSVENGQLYSRCYSKQ